MGFYFIGGSKKSDEVRLNQNNSRPLGEGRTWSMDFRWQEDERSPSERLSDQKVNFTPLSILYFVYSPETFVIFGVTVCYT